MFYSNLNFSRISTNDPLFFLKPKEISFSSVEEKGCGETKTKVENIGLKLFTILIIGAEVVEKKLLDKHEVRKSLINGSFFTNYQLNEHVLDLLGDLNKQILEDEFKYGLKGLVKRVLSATVNFFTKGLLMLLGVKFFIPGNSCSWADKVIERAKENKGLILLVALQENEKLLSETMDIPLEQLRKEKFSDLNKIYKKKILKLHPDKILGKEKELMKLSQYWNNHKEIYQLQAQ